MLAKFTERFDALIQARLIEKCGAAKSGRYYLISPGGDALRPVTASVIG